MKITLSRIFVLLTLFSYLEGTPAIYEKYVDEIIDTFVTEVHKEYSFDCISSGGSMPYDIQDISVSFSAYQKASITEARYLEIKLTEKLIQLMNEHKKIRPYLSKFPVETNMARIRINFFRPNDERYRDGSVAVVGRMKGDKIRYASAHEVIIPATPTTDETGLITNPGKETITDGYTVLLEESYEDALRLLKAENKT